MLTSHYSFLICWKLAKGNILNCANTYSLVIFNLLLTRRRNNIILRSSIKLYPSVIEPIGAYVSYAQHVEHTFTRILSTISRPLVEDFPLSFQIVDGLDGSGSHTIYNQRNTNLSTKSMIFFCFKSISIKSSSGNELWKNTTPNSPFCQRPIFLYAAKENEANIRQLMADI